MTAGPALPDLDAMVKDMREDLFIRLMRRAHKIVLIEWRDRKEAPGLLARFTPAGGTFYEFGERTSKYNRQKGQLTDYVKTGRFRDTMMTRKPRAIRAGSEVVTRLRFGGGPLNFLTTIGPVTSEVRIVERIAVQVKGYTYRVGMNHDGSGGRTISIRPFVRSANRVRKQIQRSATSYSEEFGRFNKDQPWISKRIGEVFIDLFRRTQLTKGGKLKDASRRTGGDDGG